MVTLLVAAILSTCDVTVPNGRTPPSESPSAGFHGNGALWTGLWRDGTVLFEPGGPGFVLADGSLKMKFPWFRAVEGGASPSSLRPSIVSSDQRLNEKPLPT